MLKGCVYAVHNYRKSVEQPGSLCTRFLADVVACVQSLKLFVVYNPLVGSTTHSQFTEFPPVKFYQSTLSTQLTKITTNNL